MSYVALSSQLPSSHVPSCGCYSTVHALSVQMRHGGSVSHPNVGQTHPQAQASCKEGRSRRTLDAKAHGEVGIDGIMTKGYNYNTNN